MGNVGSNSDVSYYPGLLIDAVLNSAGLPDYITSYTGIAHSADRVSFDVEQEFFTDLSPNILLAPNRHFSFDMIIDLPNIQNSDVSYGGTFDHGFGAEHNAELYWTNVSALLADPLYQFFSTQNITMGLTDYLSHPGR